MGTIHRALSSLGGALSHRAYSAGTDPGIGWAEGPVFLSAKCCRLCAWPCNTQRNRGRASWMVSWTNRWLFRNTSDTAHVGRHFARGSLLGVLDLARAQQRTAIGDFLRSCACGWSWSCGLDGLPWRAIVFGSRAPHRVHAGWIASCAETAERLGISGCRRSKHLLRCAG